MDKRAYSVLTIKAVDEEKRILIGIATTPKTDRVGDIVESEGAEFTLPLPLLLHHDKTQPIGNVIKAKVTAEGIEIEAQIAQVEEPGTLKDRIDEAWQSIKHKLIRGLSIGFKAIETARIEGTYGLRFTKWSWLELSAVTIPANEEANITAVKAYDQKQRAASGHHVVKTVSFKSSPGVAGRTAKTNPPPEDPNVNLAEHLKQLQAARAAKVAQLETLMTKSVDSGETLDAEDQSTWDTVDAEIKEIDRQIARAEQLQKLQATKAQPVRRVDAGSQGANAEGVDLTGKAGADRDPAAGSVIVLAKKLPPGVGFTRFVCANALARGNKHETMQYLKDRYPEEKPLHDIAKMFVQFSYEDIVKAAVAAGTTAGSTWAAPLVQYQQLTEEFIEFLRPQTIIGRIAGLRRVPFNIRMPRQTAGGSAYWVGEGAPKPLTALGFDNVTLRWTKLATIAVITEELARLSAPSAETIVRDNLAEAIIQQMDADFVNPANAGTTDVKPASITNGVTAVPASGNAYNDVIQDIQNIFAPFIAANLSPANGVWIMSSTTALALSLMRIPVGADGAGGLAFPGLSLTGGTFQGMPVIVSEAVGNIVILANARDILLADDGQVTIDSSREASLQMNDAPDNPATATTVLVSMFQTNQIAIRAERYINWVKARSAAVQYLSGVAWGQQTT